MNDADLDLDLLDEFVFEPTAWDLAFSLGIGLDLDADPPALDELVDAMLMWAPEATLERLTAPALARLWDDELAALVRAGLEKLCAKDDWRSAAAAALVDFDRDPRAATVSHEVIRCLAMQLGGSDQPPFFCLDCIDESLARAAPGERRALARRAAVVTARNVAVPDGELCAAVAGFVSLAPSERLGTPERRAAVRARLGRLGELGRESMPALAHELRALAAEPLPERAPDDDVWEEVCTLLLARLAKPELN